ncbi:hemin-degrading factor [Pusillimonas sp. CC-YST705]|uniref:Hemin-degrading factor n=1 Tax=Mesopusillimonas faecipullorum TaxID=2755040 RepID=A0ABS8CBC2_9BURK|nr:ChuX/HutX family heme-like substrate-binding protein [Mesopusillimonas faecipullorum]MCB5363331.1 hemin-degrading factor [Mesopusillimonas faecipullorum]
MTSFTRLTAEQLSAQANAAQQTGPQRRTRELAMHLGVSECELVHAGYEGLSSRPLTGSLHEMFAALSELGRVMALTRNDWCVHERHGHYQGHVQQGPVHMMLGPDIDLRAFVGRWRHAYAVEQGGRHSLQFFDGNGLAVHKVYCTQESDMPAYEVYVSRFAAPADAAMPVFEQASQTATLAEPQSTPEQIREAWLKLKDTHEFHPMLGRLGVSRMQALAGAGTDLAQQVGPEAVEHVLTRAAQSGLSIMCFVSNPGMVQIHTGPIQNLRRTGDWYNILDDNFNLHLNTSAIASSWVVNKPTTDGWVRSLELYHQSGDQIVQFFGERKEGKKELAAWRALLDELCTEPLAV